MCSCSSTRAARVSGVSPGSTGTSVCATTGPRSYSSSTRCTVTPDTLSPEARTALCTRSPYMPRPPNLGSSAGCTFSMRLRYASSVRGPSIFIYPARATTRTPCRSQGLGNRFVQAGQGPDGLLPLRWAVGMLCPTRALQCQRPGVVGDHHTHLGVDFASVTRVDDCLKVGAAVRGQHAKRKLAHYELLIRNGELGSTTPHIYYSTFTIPAS